MKEARLAILENCLTAIQEAHDTLQDVHDEEEEAYDNMPEGLQESERGDMMQEAIDTLDDAICSLDDAISYLEDVTNNASDPVVMEVEPWEKLKVPLAALTARRSPSTLLNALPSSFSRTLSLKVTSSSNTHGHEQL